jgi:V-type H+-transporting ATPase proteolipid subunit
MTLNEPHLLTAVGCALSIFLSAMGSAIASAHGAVYAVNGPSFLAFVPIVTAGVLAIYGSIIAGLLVTRLDDPAITLVEGYKNLAAGGTVGLACLASGIGMSIFIRQLNDGRCAKAPPADSSEAAAVTAERAPLLETEGGATTTTGGTYGKNSFRKIIFANCFLEAIGLYGLVIALMLIYKA